MHRPPDLSSCDCWSNLLSSDRNRKRPVGVTLSAKEAQLEWNAPTLSESCIRVDVESCCVDRAASVSFDSRAADEQRIESFSAAEDEPAESPDASPALPAPLLFAAAPVGGLDAMFGFALGFGRGVICEGAA
jgi:hypothetical protein